jgi:hypothetical protein
MTIIFQPVTLDGNVYDSDGVLAFRNGRLVAVLTRLSEMHGDLTGQWYMEAMFADDPPPLERTFRSLELFEACLASG